MKLTIGMIVKNEEKYLERCLTSLKQILDNVDSELIITDTGSTDRTVEIAEKFADKVLHFEWINDFAAARNTGYENAQGEWFMFVDADEIFQNCDGIINFFNSGEYRKFRSASFIIRNYYNSQKMNNTTYNDFCAPRLIRVTPDIKFVGEIHEHFTFFPDPCKNINDIADHFGYIFDDEAAMQKKFERNSSMLKDKIENDPNVAPMVYLQLYETYSMMHHREEALEYLDKGFELAKQKRSFSLIPMFYNKIYYLYFNAKYNELLPLCDDYFNMDKGIRPGPINSDGEIYAMKASSLAFLERYPEAIDTYKKYFETIKDISSGKLATYDAHLLTAHFTSDINYLPFFNDFLRCCIIEERFNTAEAYATSVPLYKYCFEEKRTIELISHEIMIFDRFGYENVEKYYSRLDEKGKNLFVKLLLVRLCIATKKDPLYEAIEKIGDNDTKEKENILKHFFTGCTEDLILEHSVKLLVECAIYSIEATKLFDNGLLGIDTGRLLDMFVHIYNIYSQTGKKDSDEFKAIAIVKNAMDLRVQKQYKECIAEMKRAVSIYEPLAPIVSDYCNGVLAEIESQGKPQPRNEMQKLAVTIKSNINSFIAAGNMEAARKTLNEFKQIMPNDPEINALEAKIQ